MSKVNYNNNKLYKTKIFSADDDLIDLINKTLVLNPAQRIDVNQALNHNFFKNSDG